MEAYMDNLCTSLWLAPLFGIVKWVPEEQACLFCLTWFWSFWSTKPEYPNSINKSEVYQTSIMNCACIDKLEYLRIGIDIGGQLSLLAAKFSPTPVITSAKQFLFLVQYNTSQSVPTKNLNNPMLTWRLKVVYFKCELTQASPAGLTQYRTSPCSIYWYQVGIGKETLMTSGLPKSQLLNAEVSLIWQGPIGFFPDLKWNRFFLCWRICPSSERPFMFPGFIFFTVKSRSKSKSKTWIPSLPSSILAFSI